MPVMTPSWSPEFRLAVACSLWPPSENRVEAIRAAAAGPLDWGRFLRVVVRHRVVGLAHHGLMDARVAVPSRISAQIDAQAAEFAWQNRALTGEAARLQHLFAGASLPVVFVKGVSLGMLAYGNVGLRHGKDLDLLVSPDALSAATALVERAGYRRFEPPASISDAQLQLLLPTRRDFGYVQAESGLELELHWRLLANPHLMDETSVMACSRVVALTETIGLRTLGKEDLFAYLCAHGAMHWWHQLKWLADVGALLAAASPDEMEQLYQAAAAKGVDRPAAQALLLCHRVFGTKVPEQLVAKLRKSAAVRWLELGALKAMTAGHGETEPADTPFGTTSFSGFLLRRNWRYRLFELKILLVCPADVLTVPLPERLHFLYPLLRLPLWLWRHGARRIRPAQ